MNLMNLIVQDIYSTNDAFAAIKSDGTIVAWGDGRNGGDSSAVQDTCAMLFLSKYQMIFVTLSGGLHL